MFLDMASKVTLHIYYGEKTVEYGPKGIML
jgi:hypothetical protein